MTHAIIISFISVNKTKKQNNVKTKIKNIKNYPTENKQATAFITVKVSTEK